MDLSGASWRCGSCTYDLVFEKLSDCLVAPEQVRKAYADAFEAWNQRSLAALDRYERA
jgi:hypothetical protein